MGGAKEYVTDIQGFQDEFGDVTIIDPVVLRSSLPTVGNLIAASGGTAVSALTGVGRNPDSGPSSRRFEVLHPHCTQICKGFDPHRKGAIARTHCGINVNSCGF